MIIVAANKGTFFFCNLSKKIPFQNYIYKKNYNGCEQKEFSNIKQQQTKMFYKEIISSQFEHCSELNEIKVIQFTTAS